MLDVNIDLIRPSPYQPRLDFDLEELKGSIIKDGILVPLTVRQKDEYYELIDGERRLRLAKELGYKTVPLSIVEADDETADRMVWKVNTLRKDYAPKEKALHYQMHQKQGASLRGIARDHDDEHNNVLALLNVLKLPERYQDEVWDGILSVAHIRELDFQFNQGGAAAPVISNLDIAIERKLNSRQFHDFLHPQRARTQTQQVEAAQREAERLIPEAEVKIETAEDYAKAAEALIKEAERRKTPEQKAEQERKKLVAEARKSLNSTAKKIDQAGKVTDVSQFRECLTRLEEALEKNPAEVKAQLTALGEEITEAEKRAKAEAKRFEDEERKRKKAEENQKREQRAITKARKQLLENHTFLREVLKVAPKELIEEIVFTEEQREILSKPSKPTTIMDTFYRLEKMANKLSDELRELQQFPGFGKTILGIALKSLQKRIRETLERMGIEEE